MKEGPLSPAALLSSKEIEMGEQAAPAWVEELLCTLENELNNRRDWRFRRKEVNSAAVKDEKLRVTLDDGSSVTLGVCACVDVGAKR